MTRGRASTGQRHAALPGGVVLAVIAAVVLVAIVGLAGLRASARDGTTPGRVHNRHDGANALAGGRRVQPRQDDGGAAPDTRWRAQRRHDDGTNAPTSAQRGADVTTERQGATATAEPAPTVEPVTPREVRIPAIGVDAPVVALGVDSDGTLEVPEAFDHAGWWADGARPGQAGPAVVVGHVDSYAGPAVFHRLRDLRRGDRVELRGRDGRVVRFAVDRLEQHPKDGFPTDAVYGDTAHPTLRLITCGGAFDRSARSYVDNVIVYASLVG